MTPIRGPRAFLLLVLLGAAGAGLEPSSAARLSGVNPALKVLAPAPHDSLPNFVHASWRGTDADGSVDHYRYAIDLGLGVPDTFWTDVTDSTRLFAFQCRNYTQTGPAIFSEPHRLLVEAIDNEGLQSPPVSVEFTTWTYAPVTAITSPVITFSENQINRGVSIYWNGADSDGLFSTQPLYYRWRLIGAFSEFPLSLAIANPDSFRRYSAASGWANWDTSSRDSASAHFTNLTPSAHYLFTVVAFDEAGAYDPVWSLSKNMLRMRVRNNVGVDDELRAGSLELASPAPNPASSHTSFSYRLPSPDRASLAIYDMNGRRICALDDGDRGAGEHRATWDLRDDAGHAVRPGLYFARLTTPAGARSRRVFVVP